MIKKVSVLIPVYNEELYVEEVINTLQETRLPFGLTMEIILVDDGSTDRTRRILQKHRADETFKVHYLKRNSGKGTAIREGLQYVTGDVVIIQDADLEYSVSDYPKLLEPFVTGNAQVVYGSRFLGQMQGMKLPNRLFNILMRNLVNWLFDARITDEATAYKLLKTDVMRSLDLKSQRFEICPEITAKLLKKKIMICEVPITYRARNHKQGKKIGWADAFTALWTLLKYRFSRSET